MWKVYWNPLFFVVKHFNSVCDHIYWKTSSFESNWKCHTYLYNWYHNNRLYRLLFGKNMSHVFSVLYALLVLLCEYNLYCISRNICIVDYIMHTFFNLEINCKYSTKIYLTCISVIIQFISYIPMCYSIFLHFVGIYNILIVFLWKCLFWDVILSFYKQMDLRYCTS